MDDQDRTPHNQGEEGLGIGAELKRAREERGLSFEEIERATKIRRRYLEGLEREDYSVMPAAVYVQGFLKTYANYLGLDGSELSRRLKERQTPQQEYINLEIPQDGSFDKPLSEPVFLDGPGRRISSGTFVMPVLAVVLLVIVVGGLYFIGFPNNNSSPANNPSGKHPARAEQPANHNKQPAPSHSKNNPKSEGKKNAGAGGGTKTREKTRANSLKAAVDVSGNEAWMEIKADGNIAYTGLAEPGFSKTFRAKHEITILTGNAGAVRVKLNGQDIGTLGSSGQVVTRSFTLKSASSL